MTRLPYDTVAGGVSVAGTFAQLTEYLRLAEEACYTISHLSRANDDVLRADGFMASGQRLAKMRELVTLLATSKASSLS